MSAFDLTSYLKQGVKNEKVELTPLLNGYAPKALAAKLLLYIGKDDAHCSFKAADALGQLIKEDRIAINDYKTTLIDLLQCNPKALPFQFPLFIGQLSLDQKILGVVWATLSDWVSKNHASRIFRVNCLQALYDLKTPALQHDYDLIVESLSHIPIASLQARIRILAKK